MPARTPRPPVPWRRWRRRARRAGALWWLLAAAGATAGAVSVAGAETDAVTAREAWGTTVVVAVAARDLEAGHELAASDAVLLERPAAVVPAGALAEVPPGAVVTARVRAGGPRVAARVGPGGLAPVAARVRAGALATIAAQAEARARAEQRPLPRSAMALATVLLGVGLARSRTSTRSGRRSS